MSEGRRKKIKLTEEEEAGERLSRWRRRTLLLFPLWSSPEDLHLSPFPSPSLSLSRHQIEIPWWCFRLPVLSESFGIYFKPEETPQNLQCSLYPEPERECGGVRLLPVVISSLLLPSVKYFSGRFYLIFSVVFPSFQISLPFGLSGRSAALRTRPEAPICLSGVRNRLSSLRRAPSGFVTQVFIVTDRKRKKKLSNFTSRYTDKSAELSEEHVSQHVYVICPCMWVRFHVG